MAKKKPKKTDDSSLDADAPSFEEALGNLQQIVTDLEAGELGLEPSLKRFEEGVGLIRLCYKTLEVAEQKIEILTGTNEDGEPETEAFDAESTWSQTGGEAKRRKGTSKKKPAKAKPAKSEPEDEPEEDDPRKLLF